MAVEFIVNLNQSTIQRIVGAIIVFLVIYTYFNKDIGLKERKIHSKIRQLAAYPFALILGFYEGILGAGNAIAFSIVSFYTRGFDFVDAIGSYYAVAFIWDLLVAILLIQKGFYDISYMIPAIIGSVLGAHVGSKYGKYKGNKFIKNIFVIIGGIVGIKLLLGL